MNARRLFAAVRGAAGAALGTYLALRLWVALGFALRALRLETSLLVLGPLFLCPAAYLGYWCFRGLRERRFAYGAAWGCAFLALLLAARPDSPVGWLGVCLLSALAVFLSRLFSRRPSSAMRTRRGTRTPGASPPGMGGESSRTIGMLSRILVPRCPALSA